MAIETGEAWEIGRELKADELKPKQIVVIRPPRRAIMITMWVESITAQTVVFYSGEMNWYLVQFRKPDGSIVDDRGNVVRVFEYLGKP